MQSINEHDPLVSNTHKHGAFSPSTLNLPIYDSSDSKCFSGLSHAVILTSGQCPAPLAGGAQVSAVYARVAAGR